MTEFFRITKETLTKETLTKENIEENPRVVDKEAEFQEVRDDWER